MLLLDVMDMEYIITLFYFPIFLVVIPTFFRNSLEDTPTPGACRWMIRWLLLVHVLIVLTPQILLMGGVMLTPCIGLENSVSCMLLIAVAVLLIATLLFYWRHGKMLKNPPSDDDPQDHKRLTKLVEITTTVTLCYTFITVLIVAWFFVIPEIAWSLVEKRYGTYFLLANVSLFDCLVICLFPATTQMMFMYFLHAARDAESFKDRFEYMGIPSGKTAESVAAQS